MSEVLRNQILAWAFVVMAAGAAVGTVTVLLGRTSGVWSRFLFYVMTAAAVITAVMGLDLARRAGGGLALVVLILLGGIQVSLYLVPGLYRDHVNRRTDQKAQRTEEDIAR